MHNAANRTGSVTPITCVMDENHIVFAASSKSGKIFVTNFFISPSHRKRI